MIRFTSTALRPLLSQAGATSRPLILERGPDLYLRVPDDMHPGEWLKAHAVGCHPHTDADWSANSAALITDSMFSFKTFIAHNLCDDVLEKYHDLLMMPFMGDVTKVLTLHKETRPPQVVYVPVGEFRDRTDWLYDQSLRHYHACVNDAERISWRAQALHVLDQVIRLDAKRAKPADRERFARAVESVRGRISMVKPDGSVRHF
ncbi:hypothetical protein LU604_05405 [Erwinia tracheiphila]|uniref:Uncharacterized protein n=1 Tax=Erwinia tracheiphila TaxID=65700 RepID=A0A345CTY0_9GAMM|nr:hypothetical protein [Erwinia tracheiphila]AXF76897.1 hypothetical protein AV903_13920 [Erwinia tracheiphila]AXF77442.1 hypothetical protein AV903_17615 [Erwinia tracheiphila]UIA83861.1 hypothetical protein LU604_01735 [Erwinia tracheiphila]UIA84424.1 hypothetical protein LU604_05405 [Erwinia tracheiphila]UIA92443.1 hypothetical protein LU632_01710 [Erwinia tracheiphila]